MPLHNTSAPVRVGIIGATGKTGQSVLNGLLSSENNFVVTSLTRSASVDCPGNQQFNVRGVRVVGYDLAGPRDVLVTILREIDILISCITWEHLDDQLVWIEAAKEAGVNRFVPSEWVGPAPSGIIDIKDKKIEILGAIQRANLPYTLIDIGCYFQVFIPQVPSGRTDHAHSMYIDNRIVGDGNVRFALTDIGDIGKYVARIIIDPRTLNRHVFAYTEVLSMNEMWEVMFKASGESPLKDYVTKSELEEIIITCKTALDASSETAHHPSNIRNTANFNMGQYRMSWCVRGDNTPEYADYLGCLDFWKLYPDGEKGGSLMEFYSQILKS